MGRVRRWRASNPSLAALRNLPWQIFRTGAGGRIPTGGTRNYKKGRHLMANQTTSKPGGYGKRPLWQWIALYVVVGAIVYGLIYLLFMSGGYKPY